MTALILVVCILLPAAQEALPRGHYGFELGQILNTSAGDFDKGVTDGGQDVFNFTAEDGRQVALIVDGQFRITTIVWREREDVEAIAEDVGLLALHRYAPFLYKDDDVSRRVYLLVFQDADSRLLVYRTPAEIVVTIEDLMLTEGSADQRVRSLIP